MAYLTQIACLHIVPSKECQDVDDDEDGGEGCDARLQPAAAIMSATSATTTAQVSDEVTAPNAVSVVYLCDM